MENIDIRYKKLDEGKEIQKQSVPLGELSFEKIETRFERVTNKDLDDLDVQRKSIEIAGDSNIRFTQGGNYSQISTEDEEVSERTTKKNRSRSLLELLSDGWELIQESIFFENSKKVDNSSEGKTREVFEKLKQNPDDRMKYLLSRVVFDNDLIEKAVKLYKATSLPNDELFHLHNYGFYHKIREDLEELSISKSLSSTSLLKWCEDYEEGWTIIYQQHLSEIKKRKEENEKLEKLKKEKKLKEKEELIKLEQMKQEKVIIDIALEFKKDVATENTKCIQQFVKFKKLDTPFQELGCYSFFGFKGFNYGFQGYKFLDYEPIKMRDQIVLPHENFYIYDTERKFEEFIPWTPLQYASACGRINLVKELVKNGAIVWIQDKTGKNASEIARTLNHHHISDYLDSVLKKDFM